MANCAIVGINWGDEGKGRMVDLLTEDYDVVVRFQGGGNAGHTVINEFGKFALHLLPSGIFRPGVVNILGNGVALDPENLWIEIAPFYSDKYQKKTVLAGELFYPEELRSHLKDLMEWKNLTLTEVYGAEPYTMEMLEAWIEEACEKIKPYVCDTGIFLKEAQKTGKSILFEAQLGSLRDLDYGIHPYTTSSNTIASFAPVGSGLPSAKLDEIVGVVKAYSTCVGEGPFVCEMFGEEAEALRKAGAEYGAKTGRPRRVGPIDIVATKYGVEVQAATDIALTKLDVLSGMEQIPVCTHYKLDGKLIDRFPFPTALKYAEPVVEYFPGWKEDISSARKWEDLPKEAQDYVAYIENAIECPITYVSVGPERDSIIIRK